MLEIADRSGDEILLYGPPEMAASSSAPTDSGTSAAGERAPASPASSWPGLSGQELPKSDLLRIIPLRSRGAIRRLAWELPRRLRQDGVDIAHFQYIGPLRSPCPLAVAVHDVSFCLAPGILGRKTTLRMRLTTNRALRAASIVLTPSEWSARMVARFFPETTSKIRMVPLGITDDFSAVVQRTDQEIRQRLGLPDEYFLYVGRRQLRKNLAVLVESYARAVKREPGTPPLVLVGPSRGDDRDWRTSIQKHALQGRVVVLDDVPDTSLHAIYRHASLFLFPCRYEGFGLPVLEAMACGTPVIVADEGGLPELVRDAGTLVDPTDPEAWSEAIASLSQDMARLGQASSRGLQIAAGYSWRATSEATFAAYAEACQS
jgi:glycosyltransferase involved in cell wall biosynthesis